MGSMSFGLTGNIALLRPIPTIGYLVMLSTITIIVIAIPRVIVLIEY